VQHVPAAGGDPRPGETPEERDARLHGDDDEDWVRVSTLAATVEAHELIDPTLSPERLLMRLFHEEGVRVGEDVALAARCRCSRERIQGFLQGFSAKDREEMREADGSIGVTCEFCSTKYSFASEDIGR
jgi:molecular chaperone Hsp33